MDILIKVEDRIIESIGYEKVESYLQSFVARLELKIAAREALVELEGLDLSNDPEWQLSRTLAWDQEKHKFLSGKNG